MPDPHLESLLQEQAEKLADAHGQYKAAQQRLAEAIRAIEAKDREIESLHSEIARLKRSFADSNAQKQLLNVIEREAHLAVKCAAWKSIANELLTIMREDASIQSLPSLTNADETERES